MTQRHILLLTLAIAPLGGQMECTPQEAREITIELVDAQNNAPLKGIVVWLGSDGQGPLARTDALGRVHLETSAAAPDVSYGFVSDSGDLFIVSELRQDLSDPLRYTVDMGRWMRPWGGGSEGESLEGETIEGEVLGADPEGSPLVWIDDGTTRRTLDAPLSYAMPYALEASQRAPSFLFAAQAEDDALTFDTLPRAFGMILDPDPLAEAPINIPLARGFETSFEYALDGLDPAMAGSKSELIFHYKESSLNIRYNSSISESSYSWTVPDADLGGDLERVDSDALLTLSDANEGYGQFLWLQDLPDDAAPLSLAPTHSAILNKGLSFDELEGASVTLSAGGSGAPSALAMVSIRDASTGATRGQFWSLKSQGYDRTLTFPIIPEGADLSWPSKEIEAMGRDGEQVHALFRTLLSQEELPGGGIIKGSFVDLTSQVHMPWAEAEASSPVLPSQPVEFLP